jgi:hypothetical protein
MMSLVDERIRIFEVDGSELDGLCGRWLLALCGYLWLLDVETRRRQLPPELIRIWKA